MGGYYYVLSPTWSRGVRQKNAPRKRKLIKKNFRILNGKVLWKYIKEGEHLHHISVALVCALKSRWNPLIMVCGFSFANKILIMGETHD